MSDIPTPAPVPVTLPVQQVKFLNQDGTVSLPWRRFFQGMINRTGGIPDDNADVLARLAAGVAEAQATAEQAEEDAQAALTAAEIGAMLSPVALGNADITSGGPMVLYLGEERAGPDQFVVYVEADSQAAGIDPLALVALSGLDQAGGSGSALAVQNQGTQITAAAVSLNFVGAGVTATASGGAVTVTIPGASGTVTSVGLSAPAEFSVSGSPVTGAGTLTLTKANQSANFVWAGPVSGASAQPSFRLLVQGDIPIVLAPTTFNANATAVASLPAPIAGTVVRGTGADGSASRLLLDAFGANPALSFRAAGGTGAAPTALPSGMVFGAFTGFGAVGPGAYSPTARGQLTMATTQAWTPTANGCQFLIATTPNGSIVAQTVLNCDQDGGIKCSFFLQTRVYTTSTLPSAAGLSGARAMVSDATLAVFGSIVVGGGANIVPVYCDGANWRIG